MSAFHGHRGCIRMALPSVVLLLLLRLLVSASLARAAAVGRPLSEIEKLQPIRAVFEKPKMQEIDNPSDLFSIWYKSWRMYLHNQIDGLLVQLRQRSVEVDQLGFKIAVVGDSTMRMQARVLAWLLVNNPSLRCVDVSTKAFNRLDLRCSEAGSPANAPAVLSVKYFLANTCIVNGVNADFVYFGCGLHILHLIPDMVPSREALDSWVYYEQYLENAVQLYRSGSGVNGARVTIGEAFMTTHSFAVERLEGEYEARVMEYQNNPAPLLATCYDTVSNLELIQKEWPTEFKPEDICTLGRFDNTGVVNLNRRAEPLMARLGVSIVQGYDITSGQSWATPPFDGRHYPALIPLELSSFFSELTSALRREKW